MLNQTSKQPVFYIVIFRAKKVNLMKVQIKQAIEIIITK